MSEWEDDGRYFWDETLEVWYDTETYDNNPEIREGNPYEYDGYDFNTEPGVVEDVINITNPDDNFWD